jgi:hypothetical protein
VVDIFEEVESDLRADRYREVFKRLAPWVIAGLLVGLLVVVGVIGFQKYRVGQIDKASDAYAAGLKALASGDTDAAFKHFGEVPASARGYRSLALMQEGGIRLQAGADKEAVALFDQAAEAAPKNKTGAILADAARLKSAFALMDQSPYAEIEARLKPLTDENRPYRAEAREALALAKLQAGKVKEARQDFVVISLMPEASDSLKARARTTEQMIDAGLLNNAGAVVKAAAALPPQKEAPPPLGIPGLEGIPGAEPGAAPAPGAAQ